MTDIKVGYIGLGLMGKHIARNILKAGYHLVVHNRSQASVDELVTCGAHRAASPSEVARQVDVVFTNLPDSSDVMKVVFGENGLHLNLKDDMIYVDQSTISPQVANEIGRRLWSEKKVYALDAPVSGGDIGAKNGTLSIMVGGNAEALERIRPILSIIGSRITHIGENWGSGQVAKASNQIMVAAQMTAMSEMLIFAKKSGVNPEKVMEAVRHGAAECWTLHNKPQKLQNGDRAPGFKASMQSKDLRIVLEAARQVGAPMPATAVNDQLYQAMVNLGMGDLDNSAVIGVLEGIANCTFP